ncbi:MAG: hypothetical protein WCI95_07565, partial [bacterium]
KKDDMQCDKVTTLNQDLTTGGAGRGHDVVERLRGGDSLTPAGEAVQYERLPVKYRDAVKRYFQNGQEGNKP